MLELHHSGLTTCSKQVRLALVEKGLPYVSRYVELFNHEQLSPAYLKLNPWGVVPTLVHDGRVIVNSAAINEYLEDAFPDRPLRPADPAARAKMRLWTWAADMVHPALQNATYNAMMKTRVAGLTPAQLDTLMARMPQPERRDRLRKLVAGGFAAEEVEQAFERLGYVIGRAEADLAGGPWLAGETYSLGDVSMLAIVDRIGELRPAMLDAAQAPRVNDWWRRMMARPAVVQVYAAGTPETPPRPAQQNLSALA